MVDAPAFQVRHFWPATRTEQEIIKETGRRDAIAAFNTPKSVSDDAMLGNAERSIKRHNI